MSSPCEHANAMALAWFLQHVGRQEALSTHIVCSLEANQCDIEHGFWLQTIPNL